MPRIYQIVVSGLLASVAAAPALAQGHPEARLPSWWGPTTCRAGPRIIRFRSSRVGREFCMSVITLARRSTR